MSLAALFEFTETVDEISITLPLKGIPKSKTDIYICSVFVKVNFPPYFCLINLKEEIFDEKVIARFEGGKLYLTCPKVVPQMWGEVSITGLDKVALKARRDVAMEDKTKREIERKKAVADKKHTDGKVALRKQMSLDEEERTMLEDLKAKEKEKAEEDVYRTLSDLTVSKAEKVPSLDSTVKNDTKATIEKNLKVEKQAEEIVNNNIKKKSDIWEIDDVIIEEDEEEEEKSEDEKDDEEENDDEEESAKFVENEGEENNEDLVYIPAPRDKKVVTFKHTPRIFNTPMRESKRDQEEEWLAKNLTHLKKQREKNGADSRDIEDKDPFWLKGKGDEFYTRKDYRGAINAYNSAISTDEHFLPAISNRAACYLHLFEHAKCIDDCTFILTCLEQENFGNVAPILPNKVSGVKLRVLVRRGTAYCQQGEYELALQDYSQASSLDSGNKALDADMERVRNLIECSRLKNDGDSEYRSGNYDQAIKLYTSVLSIDNCFVSAISNRAACYLITEKFANCVDDCNAAMDLLDPVERNVSSTEAINKRSRFLTDKNKKDFGAQPSGPIPNATSSAFKDWLIKTIVRRGNAYAQLEKFKEAKNDYARAHDLDPDNIDIASDLSRIRGRLNLLEAKNV